MRAACGPRTKALSFREARCGLADALQYLIRRLPGSRLAGAALYRTLSRTERDALVHGDRDVCEGAGVSIAGVNLRVVASVA